MRRHRPNPRHLIRSNSNPESGAADQQRAVPGPGLYELGGVDGQVGVCGFVVNTVWTNVVDGFDVWVGLEDFGEGGFVGITG